MRAKFWQIACDSCTDGFYEGVGEQTLARAVAGAKRAGWHSTKSADICPGCIMDDNARCRDTERRRDRRR